MELRGRAEARASWRDAEWIGDHWATLNEFDAIKEIPPVKLSLEASTNLPNFEPASAYFRTVKAKD